jgi:isocitrate/isopropylmalate dehydrogenase
VIRVAVLPGDGVGPEVLAGPIELLELIARQGRIELTGPWPVGASAYGDGGDGLPEPTLAACDEADALFFGAAGEHPGVSVDAYPPEQAIIGLRRRYDLRVSIRQIRRGDEPPLVVLRNLLGGAYGGPETRTESRGERPAVDHLTLRPDQISELAHMACDMVDGGLVSRIISVDKANVLATSRLWRSVTGSVAAERGMPIRHAYVDRMAFELAHDDVVGDAVILTEGLLGDILSDLAAGRAGSIALCGSASVNPGPPSRGRCVGLFEPVHGSAPRHTGSGRANPAGAYLALVALMEWFPDTADLAAPIAVALRMVLRDGPLTFDLAGPGVEPASTGEFSAAVNRLAEASIAATTA